MKLLSKIFSRTEREPVPIILEDTVRDDLQDLMPELGPTEAFAPDVPVSDPLETPDAEVAPEQVAEPETPVAVAEPFEVAQEAATDLNAQDAEIVDTAMQRTSSTNIWDMEDDEDAAEETPTAEEKTIAPGMASASARNLAATRARRNRTRLLGFEKSDGQVVDLFDAEPQKASAEQVQFPVGWLLVVEGPGRGHCFAIVAGMSLIGRGADQTVQLDFGDKAISRNNHAAVVFDEETNCFILGHGGKTNIVRLNGKPVISNETLEDGDKIKIGDTTLQLRTLCGPGFNWSSDGTDGEEHEDVAIA